MIKAKKQKEESKGWELHCKISRELGKKGSDRRKLLIRLTIDAIGILQTTRDDELKNFYLNLYERKEILGAPFEIVEEGVLEKGKLFDVV